MRVRKLSFYTPRVVVSDLEKERSIGVLDEASQYLDCLIRNFVVILGFPPFIHMLFPAVIHKRLPSPPVIATTVPPRA